MTRLALLTALLAALALPAAALAQSDAFQPLPQAQQPTQAPTAAPTTTQSTDDTGDAGRSTLFVIGGALVLLFVGIAYAITRDARQSLPEDKRARIGALREEGPHRKARENKARTRAKNRAARAARKQTKRAR